MIEQLRIVNWDKWQTFRKDRSPPPWIKLYKLLLTNPKWALLSDAEKGQLVTIWLLGSERNGLIPANETVLRKIGQLDENPNLPRFIELGFLKPSVSAVSQSRLPCGNQMVVLETETETDILLSSDNNNYPDTVTVTDVLSPTENKTDNSEQLDWDTADKEQDTSSSDTGSTAVGKPKRKPATYPPDFERFWNAYPKNRRKEKPNAYKRWKQATQTASAEDIITSLEEYSKCQQALEGFAPYPAKWLNNERWKEDHHVPTPRTNGHPHTPQRYESAGERRDRELAEVKARSLAKHGACPQPAQ